MEARLLAGRMARDNRQKINESARDRPEDLPDRSTSVIGANPAPDVLRRSRTGARRARMHVRWPRRSRVVMLLGCRETMPSHERLAAAVHRFAGVAGCVSISVGAAVLAGWIFDVQSLKNIAPGLVSMK